MGAARALRPAPGGLHVGALERDLPVPHAQHLVALGQLRQCAHRLADDSRPRGKSLDPGDPFVLARASAHPRHEITQGHRDHARLAQGGQHLLDVAQEQGGGADQENTRALQALAVRVQEIGDAMQCDRRLSCSWPALHDEETPVGGADDPVLLGLNGRDDVSHASVAGLAQRVHEGSLTLQLQPRGARRVQEFVFQPGHAALAGGDVAAPNDPVRLCRRRLVEGPRGGSAPVHEQR